MVIFYGKMENKKGIKKTLPRFLPSATDSQSVAFLLSRILSTQRLYYPCVSNVSECDLKSYPLLVGYGVRIPTGLRHVDKGTDEKSVY